MPFDIMYKQPTSEAVRFISEFARKTGDYASLSAVDIRVLAVTYDWWLRSWALPICEKNLSLTKLQSFIIQKRIKKKKIKATQSFQAFSLEKTMLF